MVHHHANNFDEELLKKGLKCDLDQYDLLKGCSEAKNLTKWNAWRKNNPKEDVWLQGGDFQSWFLEGVFLNSGLFEDAHRKSHDFKGDIHLENANLNQAFMEGSYLGRAHLEGAVLFAVDLQNAGLRFANLKNSYLGYADMEDADLEMAHLQGAVLREANLKDAIFLQANLEGADFTFADLSKANFRRAIVDGATVIWECKVNRHREGRENGTNFNGVGLNNIRIDPETRQLLEYNVRRCNWAVWYRKHQILKWPANFFWLASDYGRSTSRIMACFFIIALFFAFIYWLLPNCLEVRGVVGNIEGFLEALYFSVVVMTTLGFGDIVANHESSLGQILLMVQVISGYVLLGALVTRFTVLFTAGGPAGKFSDEKKKEIIEKE